MRFRIDTKPVPVRRFVLPAHERSTAPALPELYTHVTAPTWGAGVAKQTPRRVLKAQTPPKRTAKQPVQARQVQAVQTGSRGLLTVKAPVGPRKGRRVLEFTAASDRPMVAFLGTLALRINPDSVDLRRLELGIMSLAVDHDSSRLMGRVTEATIYSSGRLDMLAEVGDTPTATNAMAEIDGLVRAGFSPGFLIHETETLSEGDRGYDPDQMFQIVVTRFEIYEVSSTAIPRSPDARLKGVASMGNVIDMEKLTGAPQVVHTSDLIGLSLEAGRQVLASGKGSERQRAMLEEFFAAFDAALENGLTRDAAATAAKAATGL